MMATGYAPLGCFFRQGMGQDAISLKPSLGGTSAGERPRLASGRKRPIFERSREGDMDATLLPFIKLFGFFGVIIGWAVYELVKTRRDIDSKR
jgi:hypothetical protein